MRTQLHDILYIPDSKDAVKATLAYVNKLKKYEAELEKQGKPLLLTQYTVKQETLSGRSPANLTWIDTIIGSNKISNINYLRLGTVLRIPNQDGIFRDGWQK